jgi:hypothetical protein
MAITKSTKEERSYEGIPPKIEKVSEELSCELNPVEWNARAHELAEAHAFTEATKERKKSVMAGLNADLKIAEGKETKLSNIVSTNREQRDVTVEVVYDYEAGTVTKTRTDTNDVVSTRDMTTNERQAGLFDNEPVDANAFIESRHDDDSEAKPTKKKKGTK